MCVAYVTQALDKNTLTPASIMGWIPDVGAQGQDYALTFTLLWVGIICGEPIVSCRRVMSTGRGPLPCGQRFGRRGRHLVRCSHAGKPAYAPTPPR
jgi:hypothetical protein